MAKKTTVIRHGDLALVKIDKLPEGLTASNTHTLMQGSGGNNHDVNANGTVYLKSVNQFVFGYLVAGEKCQLLHPDHGTCCKKNSIRTADIKPGIYELRRQFEQTHDFFKQVID